MSSNSQRPQRGRPRDESLRERILEAAAAIALEEGTKVSFDRVARACGASRTTLYKWWESPDALLLDALVEHTRWSIDFSGTDVRSRLAHQLRSAVRLLSDDTTAIILRRLASGAAQNVDVRRGFYEHWLAPRRAVATHILEDGIAAGEVREDIDIPAVIDALFAPVYHRAFFTSQPLDDALVEHLLGIVLPGVLTPDSRKE